MSELKKDDKIEIIKFLKTAEYQKVIRKLNNSYENDKAYFEAKYEGGDEYDSAEATQSEIKMNIDKLNFFKERLEEIVGESRGAELLRDLISLNIEGIKSQMYNTATNGFGMSKDVPTFTEDDLRKYLMLHKKDFHTLIIGLMIKEGGETDMQHKYDIYDKPEDFL